MTVERYVELIPQTAAGQPLPLERGVGNFFLLLNSSALVKATMMYDGVREEFNNITAGVYIRRVKPWVNLRIDGPVGTSVSFYFGSQNVSQDETDIRLQLAQLSGVSLVADSPSAVLADTAPVVTVTGVAALVPQNLLRRRVTIYADPANTATVFFRKTGGARRLGFLSPGVSNQFVATYGMDYDDPSAGGQKLYVAEES